MPLADRLESEMAQRFGDVEIDTPVGDFDYFEGEQFFGDDHFNKKPLQIAVIGRPNAGKSTLINKIIGQDRLLTGPEAGITRDAISLNFVWNGTSVKFFDTAGMRKKAKVQNKIEKLSVSDGLRAVKFAEVVVILLDADIPVSYTHLTLPTTAYV